MEERTSEFANKTVQIKRVSKTTKGGKLMRLAACSVVGDMKSKVGVGFGKSQEVASAVKKSQNKAMKNMIEIKLRENTIPHRVMGKCGASKVFIRPAVPGTGIIACETVRNILELGGVKDALTKTFGSNNRGNVAKATINALSQLRTLKEIAKMRGLWGN